MTELSLVAEKDVLTGRRGCCGSKLEIIPVAGDENMDIVRSRLLSQLAVYKSGEISHHFRTYTLYSIPIESVLPHVEQYTYWQKIRT